MPDDDLVPDDERVGVREGDAPLEIVAVDEAVPLGVNDEVALFVGETDDERVRLPVGVPLRERLPVGVPLFVGLPVTVPERELVSEGV